MAARISEPLAVLSSPSAASISSAVMFFWTMPFISQSGRAWAPSSLPASPLVYSSDSTHLAAPASPS